MLAKPKKQQLEWHDMEIGLFIHFNMETFTTDRDYGTFKEPPSPELFNPVSLDTDQWMHAAKAIDAKYAILTAKHDSGFCIWPTEQYDYSVKNSKWRNGKGDIVADFVGSCRKYGIKPGLYVSHWTNSYLRVVHGEVMSKDPAEQERYNRIFLGLLRELFSNYGELAELWIDGGIPEKGLDIGPLLMELQPNAMVFQGREYSTIRWVGNEDGIAPYPFWNAVPRDQFPLFAAGLVWEGASPRAYTDGIGEVWLPGECDTCIRDHHWFWLPETEHTLKSVDKLMSIYYSSVGHGCNLLLNSNPNKDGLIPEADMQRYVEFGAEIKRRFSRPLAEVGYYHKGSSQTLTVELNFDEPVKIDTFVTMEDIRNGQRIKEYVIEAYLDGGYKEVVRGSSIGHKKIDEIPVIRTRHARIRVLESFAEPVEIRSFAAYCCGQ